MIKRGEGNRGQANIIVTVLLVLIALTAIAVIAYFIINLVKQNTAEAQLRGQFSDTTIENVKVYNSPGLNTINITLKNNNNGPIESIKFALSDGVNVDAKIVNQTIQSLEIKTISLTTALNIIKIEIYPLVNVNGEFKTGNLADVENLDSSDYANDPIACFDKDGDKYNFTIIGTTCGILLDCDDDNSTIYPGATELLNGKDDDCDYIEDNVNLISNPGAETGLGFWSGWNFQANADKHLGSYSFFSKDTARQIFNLKNITINPSKKYELKGWFRSNATNMNSTLYFGFVPYDSLGRQIQPQYVYVRVGSNTTIYTSFNSNSMTINLTGSCAPILIGDYLAFNANDDYSDLPNMNLSNRVNLTTAKAGYCEVRFHNSSKGLTNVNVSASAGTKVRAQYLSGNFMYRGAVNKIVPNIWTQYIANISGFSAYADNPLNFWPGVNNVSVMVYTNMYGGTMYADDISFREVL
jgi:hypothetical protein